MEVVLGCSPALVIQAGAAPPKFGDKSILNVHGRAIVLTLFQVTISAAF